ncbi:anti-sigma factor [Streptomyces sp. NPDC060194]|uniref:anti-sigma factor n=1 Tax=Streptomyces sp. NPDC060194 TaxID=3347069 RepID=UPI003667A52A
MHHLAAEDLAALAVDGAAGLEADEPVRRHLRLCPACSDELAALRRVVDAARTSTDDDRLLLAPPERVWAGISAQLAADGAPPPVLPAPPAPPPPDRAPAVAPASSRRRVSALVAVLVAVVCLVAGAGIGASAARWQQPEQAVRVRAAGEPFRLAPPGPVPGADGRRVTGTVRLESAAGPGGDRLVVSVAGLPRDDGGYYEVWLMSRAHDRMIAVGVLGPGGSARLPLPSVDLADYPVLDVSAQKLDGGPAHSGISVARGPLRD